MIRVGLIAGLLFCAVCASADTVMEPSDYRMDHYRSPVPDSLQGATVIGPEAAFALWKTDQVVFVDVLPQAPKPKNLPKGTIWRDKKRLSIPGSVWLPNVGYGAIADITDQYFRDGLSQATKGDKQTPVVFFCLADCWMSWNAGKRAFEYGYTHVFWMPEGTDGWAFYDYPTQQILPEPEP